MPSGYIQKNKLQLTIITKDKNDATSFLRSVTFHWINSPHISCRNIIYLAFVVQNVQRLVLEVLSVSGGLTAFFKTCYLDVVDQTIGCCCCLYWIYYVYFDHNMHLAVFTSTCRAARYKWAYVNEIPNPHTWVGSQCFCWPVVYNWHVVSLLVLWKFACLVITRFE